MKEERERHM